MTVRFDSPSDSTWPPLGSIALDTGDFLDDILSRIEGIYDYFTGGQDRRSLAPLGVGTSVFTLISTSLTFQEAHKEYLEAKKAHDVPGVVLGAVKMSRAGVLVGVTAISIPVRIVVAAFVGTLSKVIVVGIAFFSNLTGVGFLIVDLMSLVTYCVKIHEQRVFRAAFQEVLHDSEKAMGFLESQLKATPEEKEEIEKRYAGQPHKIGGKIDRLSVRKESKLRRVLGNRCIEMLKRGEAPETLLPMVRSRSRRNLIKLVVKLTVVIVAILSLAAGLIVVHPVGVIAVTVFTVLSSAALLAIDMYDYLKDFKQSKPGRHDTSFLALSTVLGCVLTIASILCAANVTALAIAVIFGVVWLATNAIAYVRLSQMQAEPNLLIPKQPQNLVSGQRQSPGNELAQVALYC